MKTQRMQLAWILILCLGLALAPAAALAQKANPPAPEKVNINTATSEQLQSLPGIGPALAKTILDYRAKNGKFNKIEEMLNIKGIGEKKFQQFKDRVVV